MKILFHSDIMKKYEVHYTRTVEADDFFDAVEKVKGKVKDIEEVIAVCPFEEEEDMMMQNL